MSGKFRRAVGERAGVIRRVYGRITFKIIGILYGIVGIVTLLVSEFGSPRLQHALLFRILIHRIPVWAWPTAALALVFISGVEGGVRENRRLALRYQTALAAERARRHDESAAALRKIEEDRRYDEMQPDLEARIVPWTGRDFGKSHRLEVRIMSTWRLSGMLVTFPADPRTGRMRFDLEAPRRPNELFHPGRWIKVGDLNYVDTPGCDDDLVISAKCWDEDRRQCWEDIPVRVKLPKSVPTPFACWGD
jgi:hypothetical protein